MKDGKRSEFEHDVMSDEEEHVLLFRKPEQKGAQHRISREIERALGFLSGQATCFVFPLRLWKMA